MKILIANGSILFRDGLASLIRSQGFFKEVGLAASITEAIEVAEHVCPNVVVMPNRLGDQSGIDAMNTLKLYLPEARFFFLVDQIDPDLFLAAIRAGAKGFMQSSISAEELLDSLVRVAKGEAVICPRMLNLLLDDYLNHAKVEANPFLSGEGQLTARELDVLYHLTQGASNHEIAERLFVSENTVKNHVHRILTKLKLTNRREAVNYAQRSRVRLAAPKGMGGTRFAYEA